MSDLIARLRAVLDEIEHLARDAARHCAAELATADRKNDTWQPPYDGTQWTNDYDHVFVKDTRPDHGRSVMIADCGASAFSLTPHIATHDPAFVLADIAAKRAILDLHHPVEMTNERADACAVCEVTGTYPEYPCATVRLLAQIYGITDG